MSNNSEILLFGVGDIGIIQKANEISINGLLDKNKY